MHKSTRLIWSVLAIVLAMLALTSCQFLDEVVPTIIPPSALDNPTQSPADLDQSQSDIDLSPRIRNAEDVPPTWTPPPVVRSETPVAPVEVAPRPGSQGTYTVQLGDTLAEIAERYNVTLEALALANDIEDYDHIEVGQELIIPGF